MNALIRWLQEQFSHRLARRRIQLAADHSLSAEKQRWLDEHLASCAGCRVYADELRTLDRALLYAGQSGTTQGWSAAQLTQSKKRLISTIQTRYRRHIMQKQFVAIAGTLVVLGIFVTAFFTWDRWGQSSEDIPAADASATETSPLSGEWVATTDFGEFVITVDKTGTRIIRTDLQYASWTCGSTVHDFGVVVDASTWEITDNQFTFYTIFDQAGQSGIYIYGTYHADAQEFSGTWEEFSDTIQCSGTWEATPLK